MCQAALDHCLHSIDVEESPGGLVKMQIPTQQIWGGIRDTVFLMSSLPVDADAAGLRTAL